MKTESVSPAINDCYATVAYEAINASLTPVEAVGRALGYTEKQVALAGDVLNRFVWRHAEPSRQGVKSAEAQTIDSGFDREVA